MSLRDLQLAMQRHLLQTLDSGTPAGDRAGEMGALFGAIADAPPLPRAERLAIYENAYRVRLIAALADTHPMVLKVLGDDDFADAATACIAALPSRHRSIRWYGREFADSLRQRTPFDEQPIFAELARFEWTLAEVFDAVDAPVVERAALQEIAPERWGELRLVLHPSLRRVSLRWNTVAVWRAMSRDETPPPPQAAAELTDWLLWRKDFKSNFRSLEADERAALDAALRGETFAEVCAALAPYHTEAEIPLCAATFIAAWIDGGMVSALRT